MLPVGRHKPSVKPKFYTFDNHFDGVGIVPQHQTMGTGYDYDAHDSVHNLPFDGLPEFEPNFNTVLLDEHAAVTDLISSAPIRNCGWLVSGRLRAVLDSFRLPCHRYFSLPVVHHDRTIPDYWWLQLPQPPVVIPADSTASHAEDIIRASDSLRDVAMFRLYRPARFAYCFVRQDLRTAMENAAITGVRFATSRLFR